MKCCSCGTKDPTLFYPSQEGFCKVCLATYTLEKGRANKARAIAYLGGKCTRCPEAHPAALAIHHTQPELKSPTFKSMRTWSWARIERELKTCELLCHNDHAKEHWQEPKRKRPGAIPVQNTMPEPYVGSPQLPA